MSSDPFRTGPRVEAADGAHLATYDLGGTGPVLLLAHATGFHGRVWLPVAAHLVERFHCWAFDFRGHGDSDPAPEGDYDWRGFGLDVLAVVQAVASGDGDDAPLAVGHSCGGASLLLAEEARPGTFAGLYCYEPVVPVTADGHPAAAAVDNYLAIGARRRREAFDSRAAARANFAAKAPFTAFDPAALDAYVEWGFHDRADGGVELSCRREDEARIYEAAWGHDAFARLDHVACPVAVVSGGAHAHFGVGVSRAIAGRLVTPALVDVLDDAGHFGPMERPGEVAASIVRAFEHLATVERAAGELTGHPVGGQRGSVP